METPDLINVPDKVLTDYAKVTEQNYKTQVASERTYYDGFKRMLEEIFPSRKGYLIQIEPKTANNKNKPDIVVSYNGIILFYIEAKLPKTPITSLIQNKNDHVKSRALQDQMHRYYKSGTQLLITDFMKVWLYDENLGDDLQNSSYHNSYLNFECILLEEKNNRFQVAADAKTNFHRLLTITCEDYLQTITNVKNVITPLARIAILLRNKARYLLNGHTAENKGKYTSTEKIASQYLLQIRDDFKKSIFKEEIENENDLFADLFAQTIVYGAFSAWIKYCQKGKDLKEFSITTVGDYLPFGSFLRQLFLDLRNRVPWEFKELLDEMEGRFRKTKYKKVMQNTETLITTFYSDFLHEYDPITAKERGVVYTPYEIVRFIIQGIDFMLQRWLDKPEGIVTPSPPKQEKKLKEKEPTPTPKPIDRLRILDPAAGTMAFASGLLHLAREKMDEKYTASSIAQSAFNDWVKNEFFHNMYAFEILMAPYVLGHIRTFLTLDELGLRISQEEFRLNSYLMNTLMTPPPQSNMDEWIFNNQDIGREIKEAIKIRDHRDIFVIMGNPPYNLSSQNNCAWINEKLGEYKEGLDEKNQKILADDYVKFLRFGQWKIEQVGTGVLAFITNNKYFDGQMFSVMRKSLRKTFDHIYIVNLHGDMRKNESGNPFDIRVGVGIAIMVRSNNSPNKHAAIHYMDVPHATREEKFAVLGQGFDESNFRLLPETQKNYFVEMNTDLLEHYESFIPINRLFKAEPTSGIMVGRDRLLMDVDPAVVEENLRWFYNRDFEKLEQYKINVSDTKSWSREKVYARTNFEKSVKCLQKIQYRGFDYRHLAYDRDVVEGHRMGYIDQITPTNPAITVTKASRKGSFCTAFISSKPIEKCYMSVTDTAYAFPLTFSGVSNLQLPSLLYKIDPESLFYYSYAVLWAPTYRQRYDEFLRKSYPGIPFPKNKQLYDDLALLGKKLASAHLLEMSISPQLEPSDIQADDWIIGDIMFHPTEQRLYFDSLKKSAKSPAKQRIIPSIGGITQEIWDFSIGGIPQLEQFLKSRQYNPSRKWNSLSRSLNHSELLYFLKICTAIQETLKILPLIDEKYCKIDDLD